MFSNVTFYQVKAKAMHRFITHFLSNGNINLTSTPKDISLEMATVEGLKRNFENTSLLT